MLPPVDIVSAMNSNLALLLRTYGEAVVTVPKFPVAPQQTNPMPARTNSLALEVVTDGVVIATELGLLAPELAS